MRTRALLALGTTTAMLAVALVSAPSPAAAADLTSSGQCVDGGGITWQTKVVWRGKYRSVATNTDRISLDVASWTTNARILATDSVVRTYSNGVLSQTQAKTASPDYRAGAFSDFQNPIDPIYAPGKTKVSISVSKDNDGKAGCTVTHVQPQPASASSPVVTISALASGTVTLNWTAVAGATGYLVGRDGVDTSGAGPWSTVDPPTARTRVFTKLKAGSTYTLFVQSQPGGIRATVQAKIPAAGTTPPPTTPPTTPPPTTPPPTTPPTTPPSTGSKVPLVGKSKMAWNSIVFGHGANPAGFETWRKRQVDGVLYFPGRYSWADMGQLPARRANDLMVYSIPPFPEGVGGSTTKVASGTYDAEITALAKKMNSAGWNTTRTVIRLGWENNGNWYQWGQDRGGPEAFVSAFQRFVKLSRTAGLTNVKWDWNVNKGSQSYNSGYSWTRGYPGDAYVDVIGIDPYDMWSPSFTDAQWQSNIKGKNPGLQDVADFARAHRKQMAIDEWGVVHDPNGGNDNPFYVAKVFGFAKANADIMAWDNTYDHDGAPATWRHKLSNGGNPRAAAEYRKVYPLGWGG